MARRFGIRRLRRVELSRYWRMFVVALGALAVAGAAILVLAPAFAGVFLLALYCIPTNSVFPFPHEPGVLYVARFYDPLWITLAATAGSVVVSFSDYALVDWAMRHPRSQGAREARMFRWAVRWIARAPFAIIVLFTFVPLLPLSLVRGLAPAAGYPVGRYILAQIVGRLPRFYGLAWLGAVLEPPGWLLLALFAMLLVSLWLGARTRTEGEVDVAEVTEPLVAPSPELEVVVVPDLSDPEHPVAVDPDAPAGPVATSPPPSPPGDAPAAAPEDSTPASSQRRSSDTARSSAAG